MRPATRIPVLGVASGLAANEPGSCMGPIVIQGSEHFKATPNSLYWHDMLYVKDSVSGLEALEAITELNERIAHETYDWVKAEQPFLIIGGDHSCAIGTWSGAASALKEKGPLGLIWIDAHMDCHTPSSSHTGNIHGMPLATLLGHGDPSLTQLMDVDQKIHPGNICLIGIRDYEPEEEALLNKLKVRIFTMKEIDERGLDAVFKEALKIATEGTKGYGLSIDIDVIDPIDAPGVSTPAKNGIGSEAFLQHAKALTHPNLIGIEITEFNPNHDENHKTETLLCETISKLFT